MKCVLFSIKCMKWLILSIVIQSCISSQNFPGLSFTETIVHFLYLLTNRLYPFSPALAAVSLAQQDCSRGACYPPMGDLLIGREEDQGVEGHFELRTDPDEGAAHRLHQVLPAELQVQDMVVLIWLSTQHTENIWLNTETYTNKDNAFNTHTHTHTQRERERERLNTHTHTHTQR